MKLLPVDPWILYKTQMKAVRKKYAMESLVLKTKEKESRVLAEKQRLIDQKERIKDIQEFKKLKEDSLLSVRPKRADLSQKVHPVFNMTMEELKDYYAHRRAERFNRQRNSIEKRREETTNYLLHLFHEAKDFVTFENLHEKIEKVISQKDSLVNTHLSIPEMINSKIKGQDIHAENKISKRKEALSDILNGTIAKGGMGKDQIFKTIQDFEDQGGFISEEFTEKNEVVEPIDSVLDRICSE